MLTFVLLCWMAYLRADAFKTGARRQARHRLARAELAADDADPARQRLPQSVRAAGSLLRADDPRLDHHATPICCSSCWRGCSWLTAARPRLHPRRPTTRSAGAASPSSLGAIVLMPHVDDLHPAHPPRHLMTPAARISAAIEVVADIEARHRPAADALKDWGLSHRFAGSGDRAAHRAAWSTTRCAGVRPASMSWATRARARSCSACCGSSASSSPMPSPRWRMADALRRNR